MVPQPTGHREGLVPEAPPSQPLEDRGGSLAPPSVPTFWRAGGTSHLSFPEGPLFWMVHRSTTGREPGSCSLHPRVTCLILSSPSLPLLPPESRAPDGPSRLCLFGAVEICSFLFPILLGQAQGWSPAAKQCHRMVLTLLVIIPEPWTWLCSPEKLIAITMEMPVPSEVLGLSQTERDPGDSPSNLEPKGICQIAILFLIWVNKASVWGVQGERGQFIPF